MWNSGKESDRKFGKEFAKDWMGNHYCKEFLLELANLVLTKIYYMGGVGHDLVGSCQEFHDWCAIWSVFFSRGLDSSLMDVVTSRHWRCQCMECPTSHFFCQPQGDDRSWLILESFLYDSYSSVVIYNRMHVWIVGMILWIGFFKELEVIVIMGKLNYLAWWFRLLG